MSDSAQCWHGHTKRVVGCVSCVLVFNPRQIARREEAMSDLIPRLRQTANAWRKDGMMAICDEAADALEARALHALVAEWEDATSIPGLTVVARAARRECAAQLKARLEPAE